MCSAFAFTGDSSECMSTFMVSLGARGVWLMQICAAAFGTPHRRRRFYLVASLHSDARDVLLSQASQLPLAGRVLPIAPGTCSGHAG